FSFYNSMILTIDIGNSLTKFGVFGGEDLISKIKIQTVRETSSDSIYLQIKDQISSEFSAIIISSVVSELNITYINLGEKYFQKTPFFADHTFDYGFSINYFPPKNCGSDRLVDAFAATRKYGTPVIICDFGTATTIDAVNSKNQYLGGIITPGINTLASALFDKTSKLPKVELVKPEKVIGNSTVSSIQSGIYFGYIGLVDGIIKRMFDELDEKPKVISTGGFAELIAEESEFVEIIEENLLLEGLRLIYEKIK
ncbi:MAG: type III pantothenate kinase, partial [Aridibacter sp.]